MNPSLHVYTYKDGLLSRLAHDLRLHVARFGVALADGRVRVRVDPVSARVDGVPRGETIDPDAISIRDRRTIEATIVRDVLGGGPLLFEGAVAAESVRGRLTMNGREAALDVPVLVASGGLVVDTEIVPSRWGVAPYRALAGAIRLQDRWRVRLVLPWEGGALREGSASWDAG